MWSWAAWVRRDIRARGRCGKVRKFWANAQTPAAASFRKQARSKRWSERVNGAYRLGLLLGENAALAEAFRENTAPSLPEDLEYWLDLRAESAQEPIASKRLVP